MKFAEVNPRMIIISREGVRHFSIIFLHFPMIFLSRILRHIRGKRFHCLTLSISKFYIFVFFGLEKEKYYNLECYQK